MVAHSTQKDVIRMQCHAIKQHQRKKKTEQQKKLICSHTQTQSDGYKPRPRGIFVSFPLPLRYVVTMIVADAVVSMNSVALEFARANIVVRRWWRVRRQRAHRALRRIGPNSIGWSAVAYGRPERSFRMDTMDRKGSSPSPGNLLRGP